MFLLLKKVFLNMAPPSKYNQKLEIAKSKLLQIKNWQTFTTPVIKPKSESKTGQHFLIILPQFFFFSRSIFYSKGVLD